MTLKQCSKGHFFDPAQQYKCPLCHPETPPPPPNYDDDEEEVVIETGEPPPMDGPTRGYRDARKGNHEGKTIGIFQKKGGFDPVVGWLVCVKGPDKGRDYRIRSERNLIGRARNMDLCISGDAGISRDKHAVLVFDPKKTIFTLVPSDSGGLIYVNKEAIYTPRGLNAYDRIEMGESEFLFVPLCCDYFQWKFKK